MAPSWGSAALCLGMMAPPARQQTCPTARVWGLCALQMQSAASCWC